MQSCLHILHTSEHVVMRVALQVHFHPHESLQWSVLGSHELFSALVNEVQLHLNRCSMAISRQLMMDYALLHTTI